MTKGEKTNGATEEPDSPNKETSSKHPSSPETDPIQAELDDGSTYEPPQPLEGIRAGARLLAGKFCRCLRRIYLRLKRHRDMIMVLFTAATALAAGAAVWVSQGQLAEMKRGATDTTNLVRAAQHSAIAATKTAAATEDLRLAAIQQADSAKNNAESTSQIANANKAQLEVMKIQAEAMKQQASTLRDQLRIAQSPNVDLVIEHISDYDFNSGFEATFVVNISGSYSIKGARMSGGNDVLRIDDINKIWDKVALIRVIDLVPGVPHTQPMVVEPITQVWWDRVVNRQAAIVHAMRLEFEDAAGKRHTIERCVAYNGHLTKFKRADCARRPGR